MEGKIIKGIAGFYYIHAQNGLVYECKAKGIFRKDNQKPLVGDNVSFTELTREPAQGNITELHSRKNELIRPAVANVDQAVVIFAAKDPEPNYNLLDRFLIMMEAQDIPSLICINKSDLITRQEQEKIYKDYEGAGCEILFTSTKTGENIDKLYEKLKGKTSTVAGPSGVGKSSMVNCLAKNEIMETGDISSKIKRGKNTTRHTFLMALDQDTFLMDTPGFSSLSLPVMEKEQLRFHYPEFSAYEGTCRFQGCVHISEPDCSIKHAVASGEIPKLRYENYRLLFEELKQQKRY